MKKSILAAVLLALAVMYTAFANSEEEQIDVLTEQNRVADYLRQHHTLPDYYITKKQARRLGWNARAGNLCEVLPGKAIGGDKFSNREHKLPTKSGRHWFEADVNYRCGHRGSDRLLYSNDGFIYLTVDHYNSFTRLE
ncbi:ribonuclease domain-containing protein [Xenorhabdus griffiniae]|uniref:Ribonuclease n=1 Tax=Xenorhabdus griffiniae TaxID=351672 RepID=A0ABY9XJE5_9GAMM|nr:ribonuclease domain-containing protein [Xenorhabdus griffiniae]MBD1227216.1 barnase [Xenorhabdus griffiniae]MBE8586970.1 barnase [Xenorhabdus griffiniae]WMV72908.1 ribonuclease domain-containing protein [Xenorhabdus griffiniae]WNH02587.1 ribonuclease domain-containing protein [Xenorhabdus griffiniae]